MAGKIAIAADHAGVELKQALIQDLAALGFEPVDLGTNSADSVDYPDYAAKAAEAVVSGKAEKGVLICGSGIGMSIAANRHKGIRAALCHDVTSAKLCRMHNDANILVLGARLTGVEVAREALKTFFSTPFEGGRHQRRVEKMG